MIKKIRKRINKKFQDKDFSEIFKKSASGFFISFIGRNFGFAQQLVITNFYGAAAFGIFRVCFSLLSLVGIFGRFGVDMAISRFVAQYRKQKRIDLVNEVFQLGLKLVLPLALFLSIGLYLIAPLLSQYVYHKPYTVYIQIFSVGILFFILSGVIEEGIRGLKKIKEYTWINNVSTQALSIAILLIVVLVGGKTLISSVPKFYNIAYLGASESGSILQIIGEGVGHLQSGFPATNTDYIVSISYVAGLVFTFILGIYYWLKFIPFKKVEQPTLNTKELVAVSLPMLAAKYLTTLYTWLGVLILAAFVTDADVGLFRAAARLSAFATMPLIAVNNINGPRFAEAFGENDQKAIKRTVQLSTRLIFWTCMPIMVIFFLMPQTLLGIYGKEFSTSIAVTTFAVINLGQVVNFVTGPVTQLLNMTGQQKVTLIYAALSTVISIALSILFIPEMGILGAALATGIGRTFLNIGCSIHIYITMGINTVYNPFADLQLLAKKLSNRGKNKKQKINSKESNQNKPEND